MDLHNYEQQFRSTGLYYSLLADAQLEIGKRGVKQDEIPAQILAHIKSSSRGKQLVNELHSLIRFKSQNDSSKDAQGHSSNGATLLRPSTSQTRGETLAYLRQAQLNWDRKIIKGVNTTCTRLSISLSRRRSDTERLEFAERWRELAAVVKDAPNVQFIYAEKDFFEQLVSIRNPISLLFNHSSIPAMQRVPPISSNRSPAITQTSRSTSADHSVTPNADPAEPSFVVTTMSTCSSGANASGADSSNKNTEPLNVNPFLLCLSLVQVPLSTKSLSQLRDKFAPLSLSRPQIGVEDAYDAQGALQDAFIFQQEKLANTIVSSEMAAFVREHLKTGASVSYRGRMWQILLLNKTELDEIDLFYYDQLRHCVCEYDMFVDTLFIKDVKANPGNDDRYFVFEDYLYQVLLPFSRDTYVLEKLQELKETARFNHNAPSGVLTHGNSHNQREQPTLIYPPNGIIPFYGFSMFAVPLCYLYEDPVTLYYVFREFYIRYFAKLHCFGSDPQGIIGVSVLFEQLLQTKEPILVYHLKQIGVEPLRIAFPWLMRAFLGFLTAKETLLLWDRILAFDTLEILAVLAVGIFIFRKQNLLQAHSPGVVDAIFSEMRTLEVVPILQLTLFGN